MISFRFFKATLFLLAAANLFQPAQAVEIDPDGGDIAQEFVAAARACVSLADHQPLTIGILGMERSSTTLNDNARIQVRRIVEVLIGKEPNVELKPVGDLGRVLTQLEATASISSSEVVALLQQIRDVDVAVYFEATRQARDRVDLTLVGVSRSGTCLVPPTATSLSVRLDAGVKLHDLAKLFETRIAPTLRNDKTVTTLLIGVFAPAGAAPGRSYSLCSEPIRDSALGVLIDTLVNHPQTAISDRRLVVRRSAYGEAIAAQPSLRVLSGTFGRDAAGLWVSAELTNPVDGGISASFGGRRYIAGLSCPDEPIDFLSFFEAGGHNDPDRLTVATRNRWPRIGDFLNFSVRVGVDTTVYCWVISDDETGYVLLPQKGKEHKARLRSREMRRFPDDFWGGPQTYKEAAEGLFGCFAPGADLVQSVHAAWMAKFGRVGQGENGALSGHEILALRDLMRRQNGIVEAYARVKVE